MPVFRLRTNMLLSCVALSCLMAAPAALADEFTISEPVSTTNGGFILDGGDTLTITSAGAINQTSGGQDAINATGASNVIVHDGGISTTKGASRGIYVKVGGAGDVTILGSGDIVTSGGNSTAVELLLVNGNSIFNAGNVAATGGGSKGIYTQITNGDSRVTVGDVETQGGGAEAIYTNITGTGSSWISAGNVTTLGNGAEAIQVIISGAGSAEIVAGDVTTYGAGAKAVKASVSNGYITLIAGNVATHQNADAIYLTASTGNINITVNDIHTAGEGARGVYATVNTGDINTTVNDVTTLEEGAYGIYNRVNTSGNITIVANDIQTSGSGVAGVDSYVKAGASQITVHNVSTKGDGAEGIKSEINTTGNSSVTANTIQTQGQGSEAVYVRVASGNSAIVVNAIETEGRGARGVDSIISGTGDNTVTVGSVRTTGLGAEGVYSQVNNGVNTIRVNSAVTLENGADAIYAYVSGTGQTVAYLQDIHTSGDGAQGFYGWVNDGDNIVYASGRIETLGEGAHGIWAVANDGENNVTVNGTVTTSGEGAHGVYAQFNTGSNTITNNGLVLVHGVDAFGIYADPPTTGTNTINNYGRVISTQSFAIKFDDSDLNTLNLFAPSYIGGAMDLTFLDVLNITTGPSQSALWDFSSMPGSVVPDVSGDVPYFFNASMQFATIDPSAFAAAPNMLADFSGMSAALMSDNARARNVWFSTYGALMNYDGDGSGTLDQDVDTTALALGANLISEDDRTLGAMIGYGWQRLDVSSDIASSYSNEAKGLFGGVHGTRVFDGWIIDASLSGGYLAHEDSRFVNDNLADNNGQTLGQSYGTADYDSWWFSHKLKVARAYAMDGDISIMPSVQAMYSSQFIDGYDETGTNANAQVGSRNVSVGEIKAELASSKHLGNAILSSRIGYRYLANLGDNGVNVGMIGQTQNVSFLFDNTSSAYAGFALDLVSSDSLEIGFSANGIYGDSTLGGSLKGRVAVKY